MYAVFVPVGKNDDLPVQDYGSLGNAWKPIAWLEDRHRAIAYCECLELNGEFARLAYLPEDYITGSHYVGEVIRK